MPPQAADGKAASTPAPATPEHPAAAAVSQILSLVVRNEAPVRTYLSLAMIGDVAPHAAPAASAGSPPYRFDL